MSALRFLRKIQRVHVEDDGDVFGERGFGEDVLDVAGQCAGGVRPQGDLETELTVGADEGGGEDLADGDAVGGFFAEAAVKRLQGELCPAFVGGA